MVEGYAFALTRNLVRCDVDAMELLVTRLSKTQNNAEFLMSMKH